MRKLSVGAVASVAFVLSAAPSWAFQKVAAAELADLDLEQLTRITVTSVSRREETLLEAAASLYVITRDDIRRSGATSIPDVLRLAPNLHVARADTNQYAISARGFNNTLANKLLVLIDGRTVYTPLFAGVFWEAQDVVLADIDRIEVISGPGATLWGANAVNGVINIITLPADRTQGILAYALAGNMERGAVLRHGGALGGEGYFRAYAKYFDRESHRTDAGVDIGDSSQRLSTGARFDWGAAANRFTLQGDTYRGEVDRSPMREFSGANVVGRWTRTFSGGSDLRVQAYYDRTHRRHANTFREELDTFDVEAQHELRLGGHQLVWGGGHRRSRDRVENSASQAFIPANRTLEWSNLFIQDELDLVRDLRATLGVKAEHNPYTGLEWLPSARLAWRPGQATHLVWGALSRAVRAPTRLERELFVPGRPPFALVGSTVFESEVARVAELGYRSQASHALSFSATLFRHEYPNLRSVRIVSGQPMFANDIEGTVKGIEAWCAWRPTGAWRFSGGFVVQDIDRHVIPGRVDLGGLASLGNDAERWVKLRSSWTPRSDIDVDVGVRYGGALQSVVPAYTTVDIRVAWRPTRRLEVSLSAQNAADRDYFEWNNRVVNERNVIIKVEWRS